MTEDSRRRVDDLKALAEARFRGLSQAELTLLGAAPKGEVAFCGPSAKDDDPANDPAKAEEWGPEREIRAGLIRWLCVDRDAASAVDPKGIQVHAARITRALDVSYVPVPFPLRLSRCGFNENVNLVSTDLPSLRLTGSFVRSVTANGAHVRGNVSLNNGFNVKGEVHLTGAHVGGSLVCTGGSFGNHGQTALNADLVDVKGSVYLNQASRDEGNHAFSAEGEVRLRAAHIGGNIECSGGAFKNPGSNALNAERAKVNGSLLMNDKFATEGSVRLLGAEIGGDLRCSGGKFKSGGSEALNADGANVKGDALLNDRFCAEGVVSLLGAQIGGNLNCSGGAFKNPGRDALRADGTEVKGDAYLRHGFSAEGEVRLLGARIGGNLECSRGTFKNPGKNALRADGTSVKGNVFLSNDFNAEGTVRLLGVQIGGTLACSGGVFENTGGEALNADDADVKGNVFLNTDFYAGGEVRLLGAQIGGNLDCSGGAFKNTGQDALSAERADLKGNVFISDGFNAEGSVGLLGVQIGGSLDCRGGRLSEAIVLNAAIRGTLFWQGVEGASLDLVNASVGSLVDDEKSWPSKGKLSLDGFVYGHISGNSPRDAKTRLRWLERQEPFTPKPNRQLSKVLRETGDDRGARKVLYEMERQRRKVEDRSWYARPRGWLLKVTIGYGIYPLWALAWLVLLTIVGWGLFHHGYFSGAMAPTDKDAYYFFRDHGRPPDHYQRFTASVYSLENSLPLVNLSQKEYWRPDPNPEVSRRMSAFLRGFQRAQVLLGWLLATLFVAGVTGVVRKE